MASNPLISVGSLNLLNASITFPLNPFLNVTASYLNKGGIQLALEGRATDMLPAMTAAVTSPMPWQLASITVNLLKTQPLSAIYKTQYELSTLIGPCTVRPDVNGGGGLTPYVFTNCALENVPQQTYNGSDAGWVISISGTYNINSALYL